METVAEGGEEHPVLGVDYDGEFVRRFHRRGTDVDVVVGVHVDAAAVHGVILQPDWDCSNKGVHHRIKDLQSVIAVISDDYLVFTVDG